MFEIMRNLKNVLRTMTVGLVCAAMSSCGTESGDNEPEPEVCPSHTAAFYTCGISKSSVSEAENDNVIFTEDDLEWFNPETREIRFCEGREPQRDKISVLSKIKFCLDGGTLFESAVYVNLACSQIFDDIVLCCGTLNGGEIVEGFFLYDCYPSQFSDSDVVKKNREKNAAQWKVFTEYLDSIGKLKK